MSVPRKLAADAQAVRTSSETLRPEARIFALSWATSSAFTSAWSTAGTGSCQDSTSAGTDDPT
jgi:hypothetical protein